MQSKVQLISGLIFAVVGIGHLLRYFQGWDLIIGPWNVSLQGSLIAGIVILVLAGLNLSASRA